MANQTEERRTDTNQANSGHTNSTGTANATNTGMGSTGTNGKSGAEESGIMPYGWLPTPFDLMMRFTDDLGRLFLSLNQVDAVTPTSSPGQTMMRRASWTPTVEVAARGDDLVIETDLPGVKPKDVQVEVEGNNIIIRGESHYERESKEEGYLYTERSYGTFYRSIPLPPGINTDNAHAQFNGAALEIVLPGGAKVLASRRRPIRIQMGQQGPQQPQENQMRAAGDMVTNQPHPDGTPAQA